MLRLSGLQASYGKSQVLHGVSFGVGAGEIVALLGRNGSGRSTTVKAVMGLVPARGTIDWNGQSLVGLKPFEVARKGVGYVPEGRDIFPRLTVQQNLLLGCKPGARRPRWGFAEAYALFPRLHERREVEAGALSGGEQQMLCLCRALMGDPTLLLVDEPTEGLAPRMVEHVAQTLSALRAAGIGVLLVEQKLTIALEIAQRCVVMGHGQVVFDGSPDALRADAAVRREWLQV